MAKYFHIRKVEEFETEEAAMECVSFYNNIINRLAETFVVYERLVPFVKEIRDFVKGRTYYQAGVRFSFTLPEIAGRKAGKASTITHKLFYEPISD